MRLQRWMTAMRRMLRYQNGVRAFLRFCADPHEAFGGSVQENEAQYLRELVEKASGLPGPIIELGTLFGFTTQMIAGWKGPEKELITVDNFCWNPVGMYPDAHRAFTRRSLYYLTEFCNTSIVDASSADFFRTYGGPRPAMVFADAGHMYEKVHADIRWAIDRDIPIISGHDYSDLWPGVKRAVDELLSPRISVVGSIWAHTAASVDAGGGEQ